MDCCFIYTTMELRQQDVTRYVEPLREGGSLPALVEADDGFTYALKFKGGGHGPKVLLSELIGGEVARAAGLKVPELVFLDLDSRYGITEADEEVRELLEASRGVNLGLHFLKGSFTLDPYANPVDEFLASKIVWLDAFLMNVDRTVKNTNMLVWKGEPWLIDHGASLYFHHNWESRMQAASSPFPYIKDHVFIHKASKLDEADKYMAEKITPELIREIVSLVPDEWLTWEGADQTPDEIRADYITILTERLRNRERFVSQAKSAHNGVRI